MCALKGEFRLEIIGTPSQDESLDVQAMMALMRAEPGTSFEDFNKVFVPFPDREL